MSFLKRALCAIRYYKRNTLLLFLIFTILFSLVLSGLCIRQASVDTARRTGIEVGGSVLVNCKDPSAKALSLESAEKLATHPAVKEARLTSSTTASSRKGLSPLRSQFEDVPDGPHDITLLGSNGVHPTLLEDCFITAGARPKEGEKGYAVLNKYMMDSSFLGLAVGDVITIAPEKEGEGAIDLTVIGFYTGAGGSSFHYGSPEEYTENQIFTDLETVAAISGNTGVQAGEFIMHDPAEIPAFLADVEAMGLPDRDAFGMIPLDGDYRKIALSMDSIVGVSTLIFWAAIALGAILLTALVMLSLSSREFEIGVLLSMGEGRWKVIFQLAVETLVPVLLGVTAGAAVSTWTAAFAADMLGASRRGVEVGVGGQAVAAVYLCGVALALLASCVTAYKVLRFQPKKLLLTVE